MRTATETLLDQVLPEFDVRTRHNWLVAAPPEAVWKAIDRYDVRRDTSIAARALFRLRGLRIPGGSLREALPPAGFTILAERPGEEIVAGTTGRFWALREQANMEAPADLEAFRAFARPGWAKGVFSIRVEPRDQGWSKLMTETRVQCVDDVARRRFAVYWRVIDFFSGWLRRNLLRRLGRMAEAAA